MLTELDLRDLNRKLRQHAPSTRFFDYLFSRKTNQYLPIEKLIREISGWLVLLIIAFLVLEANLTIRPFNMADQIRLVMSLLLGALIIALLLLIFLALRDVKEIRSGLEYKGWEEQQWERDFRIILDFVKSHGLTPRQVDALVTACSEISDSFQNSTTHYISANLTVLGGVFITTSFSIVGILSDGADLFGQIVLVLSMFVVTFGVLKLYQVCAEMVFMDKKKNPVGNLVEVLRVAQMNGIFSARSVSE